LQNTFAKTGSPACKKPLAKEDAKTACKKLAKTHPSPFQKYPQESAIIYAITKNTILDK